MPKIEVYAIRDCGAYREVQDAYLVPGTRESWRAWFGIIRQRNAGCELVLRRFERAEA